jgi:hypothetical protein
MLLAVLIFTDTGFFVFTMAAILVAAVYVCGIGTGNFHSSLVATVLILGRVF